MDIEQVKERALRLAGQRDVLQKQLEEATKGLDESKDALLVMEQAREVLIKVALQMQGRLSYHISSIVTMALDAVFPGKYEFECVFIPKRGRSECYFYIVDKKGNKNDPMSSVGGGLVDVLSFSLRCSFWSLQKNQPVFFLDEPFKFLSSDLQASAYQMMKTVSEKLGLQIVIVSHIEKFIDSADRLFALLPEGGGYETTNNL